MYLPGLEPPPPMADNHDGGGDEWYTPQAVLDAVAACDPEGIDLDPCYARGSLVKARHVIDARQGGDGLDDPWPGGGLVWCNPPYSDVAPWLRRCAAAAFDRPVIALVPVSVETAAWWSHVWAPRAVVLMPRGRVRFVGADGVLHGSGRAATCWIVWNETLALRLRRELGLRGIESVAVRAV